MSKIIRVVAVLALLGAVVVLGMQGTAWASKLVSADPRSASGGAGQGPELASRPQGTVVTTPLSVPLTSGQAAIVGSCATVLVRSAPSGVSYTASVVPQADLPATLPGNLVSCAIKVQAVTSATLGAETLVCWPLLPTQAGFAYYYDGSKWVKTASQTSSNQVCANVVPSTAPNPAFVAVFY